MPEQDFDPVIDRFSEMRRIINPDTAEEPWRWGNVRTVVAMLIDEVEEHNTAIYALQVSANERAEAERPLTEIEDAIHEHPTEGDSAIEERLLAVEQDLAQRPKPIPRTDPRHPQYAGSGGTSAWVDPHPYLVPRAVSVERAERERDEARRGLEICLRRSLDMEAERNVARERVQELEAEREAEAEATLALMRERDEAQQTCDNVTRDREFLRSQIAATREGYETRLVRMGEACEVLAAGEGRAQDMLRRVKEAMETALAFDGTDDRINMIAAAINMVERYLGEAKEAAAP